MKCPSCGDTGLLPNHKFCPECGFCLAHDQNIPSMEPKIAPAVSSEKPKGEAAAKIHNAIRSKGRVN